MTAYKKFYKKCIVFISVRVRNVLGPINATLFAPYIKQQLSEFSSRDPEQIFNFISRRFFGFFCPMQIREEFIAFLDLISREKLSAVMEIGTANGGALFCLSKLAQPDAIIISLDLPRGPFGGRHNESKRAFYPAFGAGRKLSLLRGDSHETAMKEAVQGVLGDKKLDLLFIDGDHSYDGVKRDFEMYRAFVRSGGKIVFHDIAPEGTERAAGGVKFFWNEIKEDFHHREIISDPHQPGFGIGIIDVP
jgi:predicted O-methyltransferase YrrM